jgi:CMP/dCMP kinase
MRSRTCGNSFVMSSSVTIAISGKSGCGNSTVSRIVAERLGLTLVNYTFRSVAEERGIEFDEICRLAESDDGYDRLVDRRQVELAAEGNCVLGSRLAIWLLERADLKVYLDASLPVRAERISRREGRDYDETLRVTRLRDERDRARYRRLYGFDVDEYAFADLVVDASASTQYEIADLIIERVGA